MVKNHKLAKSISDASWSMFIGWLEYFAKLHKIVTVAVSHGSSADGTALRSLPPQYTSQDCVRFVSQESNEIKARNVLRAGLRSLGQRNNRTLTT